MVQFWSKAAVVNNCVIFDKNLAISEQLRSDVLARLHCSHPGQEAMMSASEYIWWPFHQFRTKYPFWKNLKSTSKSYACKPQPELDPNQELELDIYCPIVD